jgi:hypothetical protein
MNHPPFTPSAISPQSLAVSATVTTQVDVVGILFIVWGLLTTLVGVSTLALGIGAVAVIASTARNGGGDVAAGLTAAAFTVLAILAMVWGSAHVIVGVSVRRHRPWSRLVALMLGAVDLLLLPYGTALGIYAIWILLNEDAKRLFADRDYAVNG